MKVMAYGADITGRVYYGYYNKETKKWSDTYFPIGTLKPGRWLLVKDSYWINTDGFKLPLFSYVEIPTIPIRSR